MAHFPVNHPLRPLYRIIAAVAGIYVLVFGIVAFSQTGGTGLFAQTGLPWVLGLRTNRAFAILSIVVGLIVLTSNIAGRNIDVFVNLVGGVTFAVAGMLMLGLMETDANFLGFSMANCIVSFILSTLLLAAGMYGRTVRPTRFTTPEARRLTGAQTPS